MDLRRIWISRGLKTLKPWGMIRLLAAGVLLMGVTVLYLAHTPEANLGSPAANARTEAEGITTEFDTIERHSAPALGDNRPANWDTYDLSLWDLLSKYPGAGRGMVFGPDIPELAHLWNGYKGCYHTFDELPSGQNVC
jgi:hypothetical protein